MRWHRRIRHVPGSASAAEVGPPRIRTSRSHVSLGDCAPASNRVLSQARACDASPTGIPASQQLNVSRFRFRSPGPAQSMAATAVIVGYQQPKSSAVRAGVVTGTPSTTVDLVFLYAVPDASGCRAACAGCRGSIPRSSCSVDPLAAVQTRPRKSPRRLLAARSRATPPCARSVGSRRRHHDLT